MLEKRTTEEVVAAVPEPTWTDTWHPVAHKHIISSLNKAIKATGIEIVDKRYTLSANGANVFSSWILELGAYGAQMDDRLEKFPGKTIWNRPSGWNSCYCLLEHGL
jgi:hypothetical protein